MGLKTAGVGHFQIPTAPAAGVSVVSGAANNLTGTAIVLSASVSAMYITGVHVETSAALAATYILVQLCVGAGGAETSIGQYLVPLSTGSTVALGYRQIYPPIPMSAGQRLSVKTADSVGSKTYLVTAECILQTNVVDDGITVGTVNLCNTLTTYTGNTVQTGDSFARIGALGAGLTAIPTFGDFTSAMKTSLSAATPTVTLANGAHGGAAAAITLGGAAGLTCTHIGNQTGNVSGSVGSVTGAVGSVTGAVGSVTGAVGSVTAGVTLAESQHVIVDSGTVTTLTNLPAITAGWLTATGIAVSALNGKGDWNVGKTGYTLTQAFPTNFSALAITAGGAVTAGTVSDKTGYTLTVTPPTAATVAAAVWDEVVTGATHNIATSAGRRMRAIGSAIAGTVVDAAATTTSFKTSLTGADTFYDDQLVMFTSGALTGQVKAVNMYEQLNGRITLDAIDPLVAAPANGDAFDILPQHVHPTSQIAEVVRMEMDANSSKLANLDAAVSTRSTYAGGAVASVTGSVGSVASTVDADVKKINGVTVNGVGTALSPWGA